MPNHIHLILREKTEGGISKFMLKLMTSYSMYFNTKYERSGPLFARPFRSKHVDTDEYLRWLFSYVHLNPLDLYDSDWKEQSFTEIQALRNFLKNYRYSSLADYFGADRPETRITSRDALPIATDEIKEMDEMLNIFKIGIRGAENIAII